MRRRFRGNATFGSGLVAKAMTLEPVRPPDSLVWERAAGGKVVNPVPFTYRPVTRSAMLALDEQLFGNGQ